MGFDHKKLMVKYVFLILVLCKIGTFIQSREFDELHKKKLLRNQLSTIANQQFAKVENNLIDSYTNANVLSSNFSSVKCVGWDFLPKSSYSKTTCHFKNICLTNSTWYYIKEDNDVLPQGIPPVLTTQPGSSFEIVPSNSIKFEIASKEIYDRIKFSDSLAIVFEQYNGLSYGHVLGDEVFPMFRAIKIFNLDEFSDTFTPIEVIPSLPQMYSCWNLKTEHVKNHPDWCKKFRSKIYPLLTNNFPVHSSTVNKCFNNVIIGIGSLTDHCRDETGHGREAVNTDCNHGTGQVFKEFYYNIVRRMKKYPPKKVMNQILVVKDSRKRFSIVSYMGEVIKIIGTMGLEAHNVSLVETSDISLRSVEEQVDMLEGTRVLICPVGSISFITFLLRPGATVILLYDSEALDHNLFSQFGHIRVVYIKTADIKEAEITLKYVIKTSFLF